MNLLAWFLSAALLNATPLSCRDLLSQLEKVRAQRVSSLIVRGQFEDLYRQDARLVLQQILLEQAIDPAADLDTIVGNTVVKVRRLLRRSKSR